MSRPGKKAGSNGDRDLPPARVNGEDVEITPASEATERAAQELPTKPTEDASKLLGQIDLPPRSKSGKSEYLPNEKVDWVVTVRFAGHSRLAPKSLDDLFDQAWRKQWGGFTTYGLDADTHRWTFAVSANGPKAINEARLAWDYCDPLHPEETVAPDVFEQRLADASTRLRTLGAVDIRSSLSPAAASRRATELRDTRRALDQEAALVLKAPAGHRFEGRKIWDVMLSLGLRWGDMDCFHWDNPSDKGDDPFFSVQTSTPPGYFLPEEIAAGKVSVEDLRFGYSIPRCARPVPVFDAMTRAVQYCQRRLGGEITDAHGAPADLPSLRRHVSGVEQRLTGAGLPAGSDEALRLF